MFDASRQEDFWESCLSFHTCFRQIKLCELKVNASFSADEIPKEDTMALLAELADPEDEDGMFPYKPFLDRLTGKA